jgi:hypothetical protein
MHTHPSYPTLLDAVRRVFGAHAAVLFMPETPERFTVLAADCPDETVRTGAQAEAGKGLVGWILRHRQPLIVNDFDQRSSHLGYYEPRGENHITAFMGCPLDNGGVLCVDAARPCEFNEEHMEGLTAMGFLFAQLPPVAADTEDVRRYFTRLERIQELRMQHTQWKTYLPAFLALLVEATRFDHVAFAARPDNSETYSIEAESASFLLVDGMSPQLPLAGSVTGWVFRHDMPVHTEGLNGATPKAALYGKVKGVPDFRSVVCLPVAVNRAPTAALCLGGLEPRPIPQAMRSFIRMATDELVQFLEALYLRHRVHSLLPKAKLHKDGATVYNPDTAPSPKQEEE